MAKPLRGARAARVLGRNVASVEEMRERGIVSQAEACDLWRRLGRELEDLQSLHALNEHQYLKVRTELDELLGMVR
ncbi:MAG: hypothetical protein IJ802_06900 [Kiritimatiellae bacterium]|nr:hypothetical protein [Kiritimatiellia bacterium]